MGVGRAPCVLPGQMQRNMAGRGRESRHAGPAQTKTGRTPEEACLFRRRYLSLITAFVFNIGPDESDFK